MFRLRSIFAVGVLRVPELIVCGHTDCGVMKGALNPDALADYPNVTAWLRYARFQQREQLIPARNFSWHSPSKTWLHSWRICEPTRWSPRQLEEGDLALHGWVYHIGSGVVTAFDQKTGVFTPVRREP